MKYLSKIAILFAIVSTTMLACKKVESLPNYANGTAITLSASKTSVTPTLADTTKEVVAFTWTNPNYATASSTYKFVLEIDSTNTFATSAKKIIIGQLNTSILGRELNAILLNFGYSIGVAKTLYVRAISSYGNNNERYLSNVVNISVTPYNDPAILSTSSTSVTTSLPNANLPSNTFSWTKSFIGYSGNINYTLQYDSATKNFANAKDISVGSNLLSKALTQGEMNETALNSNVPGGNSGKIEYRVKAVTAQGAISYSNTVSVTIQSYIPIIRLYMPGGYQGALGHGTDWSPSNAPELIRDTRSGANNSIYYTYIYLRANDEFKFTEQRDWNPINFGAATSTTGTSGSLGTQNFKVLTSGVYRISIDRTNQKYDIRLGRMGFVGGAVPGNGWSPSTTFSDVNSQMGYVRRNQFIGVNQFNTGGWKMIDNDSWNNGDVNITNNRSYGTPNPSGSALEINGGNMADISTAGRYRVIWDGTDPNSIKYHMNSAAEMRVVGDGINQSGVNDWDPGSSPQMTYNGNGVWQISITLKANKSIKFLAGNAWGAFDYEDDGAGAGVGERKLKWDGGNNFSTPSTAGTYTIILNEKTGIVSIN
jgi:hypothetical protein